MKIITMIISIISKLKNKINEIQNSLPNNFWSNYFCLPLFVLSINYFIGKIFTNSEILEFDKFYWLVKIRAGGGIGVERGLTM